MESATAVSGAGRWSPYPSWPRVAGAVLLASIATFAALILAQLPLFALRLMPTDAWNAPGRGWPWRIDGAWAALADLGPALGAGFVFATITQLHLAGTTRVNGRRWRLALTAVAVGWLPVGAPRAGIIAVGGLLAFVLVAVVARDESLEERANVRLTRSRRALALAAGLAMAAVSLSYGALHPLTSTASTGADGSVTLSHGRSARIPVRFENRGRLAAEVLRIDVAVAGPLRVARTEADGPSVARDYDGLFRPFTATRVRSGDDAGIYLTLAAPRCWTTDVSALDVRMRVAGMIHTQRVPLSPPWHVTCRP